MNILCINKLKCGHNCKRDEQPSITHVRFGYVSTVNTRGYMWSTVENIIPLAMYPLVWIQSHKSK